MTRLVLHIYDYLLLHTVQCALSLCVLTSLFAALILRLDFKEDISAFLPFDEENQKAMQVYQDVSGASKLLAIFQFADSVNAAPDDAVAAMDLFAQSVAASDTMNLVSDVTTQIDIEKITELTDFVYCNIPYFLTEADYQRMDSLLDQEDYVASRLQEVKQLLMFPTSGLLSANIGRDPLNLFTPTVSLLRGNEGGNAFDTYDGYIFTRDMQRGIVLMTSRFGNSETKYNAMLMDMLNDIADSINAAYPSVSVHYIGGPAIAVGNASQIRHDSIVSVLISVVLIMLLLVYVFRSLRNILLIVVSIIWGWLFALSCLSLVHDEVSLIVVGISSIILGIAVNYPLHLIAHSSHACGIRQTLKEIISPLVIGNITTVGAFMALVPLKANALRDLGLFSAFLLIGTILFVIIYLPHATRTAERQATPGSGRLLDRISGISLENNKFVVWSIVVLTFVFGWFSLDTRFDANMSHINYMTEEQHHDMEYFQQMTSGTSSDQQCIYVVSEDTSIDRALDKDNDIHNQLSALTDMTSGATLKSCSRFFPSQTEQTLRIERWNRFVEAHRDLLTVRFLQAASSEGFSNEAFLPFMDIISDAYEPHGFDYFQPLLSLFPSNFSSDQTTGTYRIVECLFVNNSDVADVKQQVKSLPGDSFVFDIQSLNSTLANSLTDDFNYIGWACGLIVFFFLWFSFGNIELAMLSFLPMAVSWVWILGIMGLTGTQFNIVNIILATFIFGQGDDYTIFMTEGCCFEYAHGRKMVASYKSSIIVSALIMFIGIGTLIFAKHPALHSLAEVTVIGMFSVVLMAYILPPLIFNWMVRKGSAYRKRPLTLVAVLRGMALVVLWPLYRLLIPRNKSGMRLLPGVNIRIHDAAGCLSTPSIIVCSTRSRLDRLFLDALCGKSEIVSLSELQNPSVYERLAKSTTPVLLACVHGADEVVPQGSFACYAGDIHIHFLRVEAQNVSAFVDGLAKQFVDGLAKQYAEECERMRMKYEDASYFTRILLDHYRYRGVEIYRSVRSRLASSNNWTPVILEECDVHSVTIQNDDYGELPLLYALTHPHVKVNVVEHDDERRNIASNVADLLTSSVNFSNQYSPQ